MHSPVAAITAALIYLSVAGPALAGFAGPHPVLRYGGNEYAFVVTKRNAKTDLVIYRAVGSLWQRIGATSLKAGQRTSNGTPLQNVWFKGRRVRTINADLRNPFYRYYPGRGNRYN